MSTHRLFVNTEFDLQAHADVRPHMERSRQLCRKMLRQLGQAVHPDPQAAPADLQPHVTPTGNRWHELGHRLVPWACAAGALVVLVLDRMGWL